MSLYARCWLSRIFRNKPSSKWFPAFLRSIGHIITVRSQAHFKLPYQRLRKRNSNKPYNAWYDAKSGHSALDCPSRPHYPIFHLRVHVVEQYEYNMLNRANTAPVHQIEPRSNHAQPPPQNREATRLWEEDQLHYNAGGNSNMACYNREHHNRAEPLCYPNPSHQTNDHWHCHQHHHRYCKNYGVTITMHHRIIVASEIIVVSEIPGTDDSLTIVATIINAAIIGETHKSSLGATLHRDIPHRGGKINHKIYHKPNSSTTTPVPRHPSPALIVIN